MSRSLHSLPAWRAVLFGAVCVGAGWWCGLALRTDERPRIWQDSDPGAVAPSAVAPASFRDLVAQVAPGVVTVRADFAVDDAAAAPAPAGSQPQEPAPEADELVMTRGFRPPVLQSSPGQRTGSGFLVDRRGLLVTSRHLVAGARSVEVLVTGRGSFRADVVGEDPATDLALVRLAEAPVDLPALRIGRSEDLRAGDWIVAVGNPFGFAQTVTAGIVSYVGRHLHTDLGVTSDYLQFSAPVNPGSSGCPLFDRDGNVVGVTTQAATAAQGISFAVPSRTLKWTLDEMAVAADGKVRRGYLGIEFASRRGDPLEPCEGAVITRVTVGQPAEQAGLRRGDVVLAIDGEPIADASSLHSRILQGRPGSRIQLQLLRDGRLCGPIEAKLGELGLPRALGQPN